MNRKQYMPKDTANKENNIQQEHITSELFARMVDGETTLEDLTIIKNVTASGKKTEESKAYKKVLENLTNEQLHAFTSTIARYAHDLTPAADMQFMCRGTSEQFMKTALLLLAQRNGMKVEFDPQKQTVDIVNLKISPAIADIYATLRKEFYPKRNMPPSKDVQTAVAESISFLLLKSLVEETSSYKKLDPKLQVALQQAFTPTMPQAGTNLVAGNIEGITPSLYIDELINNNILNKIERGQIEYQANKQKEEIPQTKKNFSIDFMIKTFSEPTAHSIIKESLATFDKITPQGKDKVTVTLSPKLVESIHHKVLLDQQNDISATLTAELKKAETPLRKIKNFFSHNNSPFSEKALEKVVSNVATAIKTAFLASPEATTKSIQRPPANLNKERSVSTHNIATSARRGNFPSKPLMPTKRTTSTSHLNRR